MLAETMVFSKTVAPSDAAPPGGLAFRARRFSCEIGFDRKIVGVGAD